MIVVIVIAVIIVVIVVIVVAIVAIGVIIVIVVCCLFTPVFGIGWANTFWTMRSCDRQRRGGRNSVSVPFFAKITIMLSLLFVRLSLLNVTVVMFCEQTITTLLLKLLVVAAAAAVVVVPCFSRPKRLQ